MGIAGGFIAFFIADSLKDKQVTPEIRHEIVGPGIKSVAYRPEPENTVGGAGSVDLREAAKKSVPGVVHVKTMQMGREFVGNSLLDFWFGTPSQSREVPMAMGYGSGVIISDDGYIITNNHVIKDADKIVVVLNDKKNTRPN